MFNFCFVLFSVFRKGEGEVGGGRGGVSFQTAFTFLNCFFNMVVDIGVRG